MLMIAAQTLTADQEYTPEGFWATDELIRAIAREGRVSRGGNAEWP